jgi:hypothetical protein
MVYLELLTNILPTQQSPPRRYPDPLSPLPCVAVTRSLHPHWERRGGGGQQRSNGVNVHTRWTKALCNVSGIRGGLRSLKCSEGSPSREFESSSDA